VLQSAHCFAEDDLGERLTDYRDQFVLSLLARPESIIRVSGIMLADEVVEAAARSSMPLFPVNEKLYPEDVGIDSANGVLEVWPSHFYPFAIVSSHLLKSRSWQSSMDGSILTRCGFSAIRIGGRLFVRRVSMPDDEKPDWPPIVSPYFIPPELRRPRSPIGP
jgi:hypothetical protein